MPVQIDIITPVPASDPELALARHILTNLRTIVRNSQPVDGIIEPIRLALSVMWDTLSITIFPNTEYLLGTGETYAYVPDDREGRQAIHQQSLIKSIEENIRLCEGHTDIVNALNSLLPHVIDAKETRERFRRLFSATETVKFSVRLDRISDAWLYPTGGLNNVDAPDADGARDRTIARTLPQAKDAGLKR